MFSGGVNVFGAHSDRHIQSSVSVILMLLGLVHQRGVGVGWGGWGALAASQIHLKLLLS